jgi:hypothetical protein
MRVCALLSDRRFLSVSFFERKDSSKNTLSTSAAFVLWKFLPLYSSVQRQRKPWSSLALSVRSEPVPPKMLPQSKHIAKRLYPFPASLPLGSHSANQKSNFARDLQERLGILALLALPAPFRICKLQILLATGRPIPSLATKISGLLSAI